MEDKPGQDVSRSRPTGDDEISLVELANTVLRQWRLVIGLPLLLGFLVGVWTLSRDRLYVVNASFVPQLAEGRGAPGGATALAQQFGVTLGTDRPGQTPQFFADLIQSLSVLRKTVETEYAFTAKHGEPVRGTLIAFYEIDEEPGRLPAWRRAVEELRDNVSTSVGRETGVVKLTVSAPHPVLAEQIAQRLLELLNELNQEVRQTRAQEEGRFIAGRVAESHAELLAAEHALQEFLRQNREFRNSPELLFDHDRLQRQVAMRQEVYTTLVRLQEQARIDAVRDTPLLTVIDQPAGAAEPKGRGTVLRALLALMLGGMIAVFLAFMREFGRRGRETGDPHYQEFQGLVGQVWQDVRRPGRWLRKGRPAGAAGGGGE